MIPTGQRGFQSAQAAKDSAALSLPNDSSFVVIAQRGPEFAWISPVDAFMERSLPATAMGIMVAEIIRGPGTK